MLQKIVGVWVFYVGCVLLLYMCLSIFGFCPAIRVVCCRFDAELGRFDHSFRVTW